MEKIIIILVILAILYFINTYLKTTEGFEGATQSLGGVDDANSINTLAQIARKLMDGGVTVPGNIAVQGDFSSFGPSKKNRVSFHTPADGRRALYIAPERMDGADWEWGNGLALDFKEKVFNTNSNSLIVGGNLNVGGNTTTGNVFFGGAGPTGFNWGNEGGNGWSCLRANAGKTDDSFCMHNTHGGGTRLLPGGDMTVKGRNILAEIDAINNKKIIITHAQYGSDQITAGVAVNHLAHKANSNGSYAFDYKIGTQWNGENYDPQHGTQKGFFCAFKCGLNGNVNQIGRGGPADGQVIRIAC